MDKDKVTVTAPDSSSPRNSALGLEQWVRRNPLGGLLQGGFVNNGDVSQGVKGCFQICHLLVEPGAQVGAGELQSSLSSGPCAAGCESGAEQSTSMLVLPPGRG